MLKILAASNSTLLVFLRHFWFIIMCPLSSLHLAVWGICVYDWLYLICVFFWSGFFQSWFLRARFVYKPEFQNFRELDAGLLRSVHQSLPDSSHTQDLRGLLHIFRIFVHFVTPVSVLTKAPNFKLRSVWWFWQVSMVYVPDRTNRLNPLTKPCSIALRYRLDWYSHNCILVIQFKSS